ncbi:SNF2 family domain-containing protein [Colletotrichum orchidophilum]|uniref:SNF2 family domain-containing protein n=1 Tax=Colletotrichum orchidophilum TaxID=1209926 RepID=A0A1G4B598_9PEZI|nr:SNF2 family domain-containing protein [Colletotrichum orchidophilum]OHE96620.1 SNF2 family domain-containing protein [Colletotrichum orchidophilum]
MDDDPAATQARDKEALRTLASELLDLEGERDFRQAIAESLADGNPRDYENALREYESAAKTIANKTLEKQRLEQRIRAARNSARLSTRDATFGEDANMRAARDRWGVAHVPYRATTGSQNAGASQGPSRNPHAMPNSGSGHAGSSSWDPFQAPPPNLGSSAGRMNPFNNKRSFGTASDSLGQSSPGRSKSQRTTDVSDVIDLTGDDDDVHTSISRSRQLEAQERGRRAASLARARNQFPQANPYGTRPAPIVRPPGAHDSLGAGFSNGLQNPNNGFLQGYSSSSSPSSMTSTPGGDFRSRMPGSYFDDDDLNFGFTPASQMMNRQIPNRNGYLSANRSSLSTSDVINRTNNFNFMDLTNNHGNPLDARVVSIMEDINNDPRRSKEEVEALLRNVHAGMDIPEEDREGTPDAMRYPLYAHQRVALTWMMRQEKGTNKGGILADDMGLGKTISVLSLMVSQKSTRPGCKTTLIVAPLSLIRQWEDEIKKKLKTGSPHALTVCIHHSTQKIKAQELMKFDVVLTTYGTLVSDRKKWLAWLKDLNGRPMATKTDPGLANSVSLFHPDYSRFYRVVLDESQQIKNHKAQAAEAASYLQSDYRWCLSGTPMMNGVDELYSLYRFLKIKPYNDWSKFRGAFGVLFGKKGDPQSQAMRNLQVLLKATLLRRTKTSTIDGKPILQLPEKTEEVVYAELDEDERKFYTDLETKSQVQINKYLRKGTLGKHYSHVLVLLLRLRQTCCHPHLLLEADDAVPEVDDDMLSRVRTLSAAVVQRLTEKSRALESADAINEGFECPICYDMMPDPTIPLPCGHELCAGCLKQHVDNARRENIRNGEDESQVKCAVCRGTLNPASVITFSAFKKVYMPDDATSASSDNEESDGSVWSSDDNEGEDEDEDDADADDVDKHGNLKGFVVPEGYANISDEDDELSGSPAPKPKASEKTKSKGKMKAAKPSSKESKKRLKKIKGSQLATLRKNAKKNIGAWQDYTKYLSHHWLASSKTRACVDLLKKIQETGEKTIIFSQWTMLLDLLQVAIRKQGLNIKHCRYTGEMTMAQRDDTAFTFSNDPSMKVMMVSLRAGNAGLNLVAASQVIIMDPFWNPYIEMQAVDRAHRIGQQKPVQVHRILTQQTVEDRIVQLQEKKRATVDAALDEREGAKLAGLSLTELRFLFNL